MASGTASVKRLRAEREKLLLSREVSQLRAEERAIQEVAAFESLAAYRDYVDPREWQTDPYGNPVSPVVSRQTRQDGRDRPFIESEQDLALTRGLARYIAQSNLYAAGILENLANFVIGSGFHWSVASKEGASKDLVADVQNWLDELLDDNDWIGDGEREFFVRWRRDGEAFTRLHHVGDGRVLFRFVEPEFVTEPLAPGDLEYYLWGDDFQYREPSSWSFGVQTPEGDTERVQGYFLDWTRDGRDWEYVPAAEVEHLKANVDRNVKRGLSDFFSTQEILQKALKLLSRTIGAATVQASIAFIREHASGVTGAGAERMVQANAAYTDRMRTAGGATRATPVQRFEAEQILDIAQGMKYHPGPMGSPQGPLYLDVLQGALRAAGARWSMPEYMVSGDASNNNYASILEAGSPFRAATDQRQSQFKRRQLRLGWKALAIAHQAGRFARHGLAWSQLKRLVELQVEPPETDVSPERRTEETDRRVTLVDAGLMSDTTAQLEEGLDPEQEQVNKPATGSPALESLVDRAAHRMLANIRRAYP